MGQTRGILLIRFLYGTLLAFGLAACAWLPVESTRTDASEPALAELAWLSADTSTRVEMLTTEPVACLAPSKSTHQANLVRAGELAFASASLLGGQAEKKRLSCAACHRNGRGNQHFSLQAVSGEPGTADVTSGLFGVVRADDRFNPVPIPDLSSPAGQDQVNRADSAALNHFITAQVVEELSGDTPPSEIITALVTYLQAIDESWCETATARRSLSWQDDWSDASDAALLAAKATTPAVREFYISTARGSLRRLHERYTAPEDEALRKSLIAISRNLVAGQPWPSESRALETAMDQAAVRSLYNPAHLASELARTAP